MILKMLKTLKTETNQCFFRPFSKNLESSWCLMSFARSIISMILGFSRKAEKNLRFLTQNLFQMFFFNALFWKAPFFLVLCEVAILLVSEFSFYFID